MQNFQRSAFIPEPVIVNPLEIIDQNEKANDTLVEMIIEQASQLLSHDKDYYDVKKELLRFENLDPLATHLMN